MEREDWYRLFSAWDRMAMAADEAEQVNEMLQEVDGPHDLQYAISHFSGTTFRELGRLHNFCHHFHNAPRFDDFCSADDVRASD
jgi:hypothetical protein